ncbi:hypothetical protein HYX14_02460 [Candidatus Woesearchaeota archaeon]|nr:hypothetical protein [Candidatus Woesearchaeota archaeon]
MKRLLLFIVGVIAGIFGLVFAIAPHGFHTAILGAVSWAGPEVIETSHTEHKIIGAVIVLLGMCILIVRFILIKKKGKE